MPYLSFSTPHGPLTVFEDDGALVAIEWGQGPDPTSSPVLDAAREQLGAYFQGRRRQFDLPLRPTGTPFQLRVWEVMRAIPFGSVRTYGALARELGSAPRAVGQACGRNPLPIVIPCHRVVGAGGQLTGYSGGEGVATKRALLHLEEALVL